MQKNLLGWTHEYVPVSHDSVGHMSTFLTVLTWLDTGANELADELC
jgi:hypothetical protein